MTFMEPPPPLPWWKRLLLRWRMWRNWRRLMRKGMTIPMVKRPFPGLNAEDIVSVQPMTGARHAFILKTKLEGEDEFNAMDVLEEDSFH